MRLCQQLQPQSPFSVIRNLQINLITTVTTQEAWFLLCSREIFLIFCNLLADHGHKETNLQQVLAVTSEDSCCTDWDGTYNMDEAESSDSNIGFNIEFVSVDMDNNKYSIQLCNCVFTVLTPKHSIWQDDIWTASQINLKKSFQFYQN